MKIQSSTRKNIAQNKTKTAASTSGQFQSIFAEQNTANHAVQAVQQQPQQQNPPSQQPMIEDALNTLEKTMLALDEGEQIPEQMILAINDLRIALKNNPQQLSPQASAEAETLLAVEAKRLETLNKI